MGRHRRGHGAPAPVLRRYRGTHRRRRPVPVRTGLLGASAAMAVGTLAVASGLLPGPAGDHTVDGPAAPGVHAGSAPGPHTRDAAPTAGTGEESAEPREAPPEGAPEESAADRGGSVPEAGPPSTSHPGTPRERRTAPSDRPERAEQPDGPSPSHGTPRSGGGSAEPSEPPGESDGPRTADSGAAAEAEVLKLVNRERSRAGCRPLTADASLAELAGRFSRDMAERGFFSHVDPDGDTPWERAEEAGIDHLAAENIARGQADARAVVEAWMAAPGHRANILNCDYETLGVGVHVAEGGPWWTQDFGY